MATINRPSRPKPSAQQAAIRAALSAQQQSNPNQGRENPHREIYGSSRWKKLSKSFRDKNPLCRQCKQTGRLTPTYCADHIVPINEGGDPWDIGNLQPLCLKCHQRKSAKESHRKS
ncbi:putative phage-related protein [Fibrisoma limi BUZ 3]|uniref:Putative phage-related protein n=1 Tax=Fibrisoma limi BUZ 3 TaxID=1185876 RepID=I2GKP4_9BACT|nr:HNH endonuclease signature motif containing protein [Fibrisoma limi]CCH54470.1 putative phage-related protein [Fibrisoma limi BUZ 3]